MIARFTQPCLTLLITALAVATAFADERQEEDPALANALRKAAKAGNLAKLDEVLATGIDPDTRGANNRGWTALELISMGLGQEGYETLHSQSPDLPGEQWEQKKHELEAAVAKRLIDAGANSFAKSLARTSNPVLIRLMVESGGSPNLAWKGAIASDDPELIRFLVGAGATFDAEVGNRSPPFVHAGAWSSISVLEVMVELGADPNARSEFNATALHGACSRGRDLDVIKKLIELGVDPTLRNNNGKLAWQRSRMSAQGRAYLEEVLAEARRPGEATYTVDQIDALIDRVTDQGWPRAPMAELAGTGPLGAERIVARLRRGSYDRKLLVALQKMGPDAAPAIDWLTQSLHEPAIAFEAANTLQQISRDAWASTPLTDRAEGAKAAYEHLLDPARQAHASVEEFAQVFGAQPHPHIAQLLSHRVPAYRVAGSRALIHLFHPDEALIESLKRCLLSDPSLQFRESVAYMLVVNPGLRAPELERAVIAGALALGSAEEAEVGGAYGRELRHTLSTFVGVIATYPGSSLKKLLQAGAGEDRYNAVGALAVALHQCRDEEDRDLVFGLIGSNSRLLQIAVGSALARYATADKQLLKLLGDSYRVGDAAERETAAIALAQVDGERAHARRTIIATDPRLALATRALALRALVAEGANASPPADAVAEFVREVVQALNDSEEREQLIYLSALKALGPAARDAFPAVRELRELCFSDPDRAHVHRAAASTAQAIE